MTNSPDSAAADERAAAGARRKAYVEQHGRLPSGSGIEQRSLGDVVNNQYVAGLATGLAIDSLKTIAPIVVNKVKNAVTHQPGKHEQ